MRYVDSRRVSGVGSVWLRLRLWLAPPYRKSRPAPMARDLSHLSDHERRDIGLPEPVRYVDWRALRESGWQ